MSLLRTLSRFSVAVGNSRRLILEKHQQIRNYAEAATAMNFTFACPAEVFYKEASNVRQVDVPSYSGSFGILPNHVPLLAVLKPGVVTVFEEDASKKFFVSSGSVTINADSSVQILAEEAVPLEQIDVTTTKDELAKSQQRVGQSTNEKEKAEALIEVEVLEAALKAVE